MFAAFEHWVAALYAQLGYPEILLLMALESSLFPIPAEAVMIPAGYLARNGQLNPFLAVLYAGTGSVIGASFNYLLGRTLGRAVLLRLGPYFLISEAKYHAAEKLFLRNARLATFGGRLLPVIRHLISLPAGVFEMPKLAFVLLTLAGSLLWSSVLVAVGYYFGEAAIELVKQYIHELTLLAAGIVVIGAVWFVLLWRVRER